MHSRFTAHPPSDCIGCPALATWMPLGNTGIAHASATTYRFNMQPHTRLCDVRNQAHDLIDHLNRIFDAGIRSGMYVFGQVITGDDTDNGDDDQFLAPYLQSAPHAAYDFPLFNPVRNAFGTCQHATIGGSGI